MCALGSNRVMSSSPISLSAVKRFSSLTSYDEDGSCLHIVLLGCLHRHIRFCALLSVAFRYDFCLYAAIVTDFVFIILTLKHLLTSALNLLSSALHVRFFTNGHICALLVKA